MKWFFPILFFPFCLMAIDEIRLDKAPYAGANMPIQYQADTELCYAYSAVYLMDFERNDKLSSSSPFLFGIDYKNNLYQKSGYKKENETPNLGKTCDAISNVKRVFKKTSDNNLVEEKKFKYFINSLEDAYLRFDSRNINSEKGAIIDCLALNVLDDILGIKKSVASIENTFTAPSFINFLAKTLLEDEKSTKADFKCKEINLDIASKEELFAKLEAGLDHKKPVAITYCSSILLKGNNYEGIKKTFFGSKYYLDKNCGNHASVIVGKRIKNGIVQYLVQDSMGSDFQYHPDLEKEDGRIWIDKKVLLNNMSAATFID